MATRELAPQALTVEQRAACAAVAHTARWHGRAREGYYRRAATVEAAGDPVWYDAGCRRAMDTWAGWEEHLRAARAQLAALLDCPADELVVGERLIVRRPADPDTEGRTVVWRA